MYVLYSILGVHYFSIALMNHNTASTKQVEKRNASADWGIAQLHSSADWATGWSFYWSAIFLWLNYHTVHHLFPNIDMYHHPAIQKILIKTCSDHKVEYTHSKNFIDLYLETIKSFSSPRALGMKIESYAGGIDFN